MGNPVETSLFWYKLVFVVELMVAEGFATYSLKKRDHFALRCVISIFAVLAAAALFPIFFGSPAANTVNASILFLTLFGVTVAALKLCYDEKLVTLFFCGVLAYTTQHIAYSTYHFLVDAAGVKAFNFYGASIETNIDGVSYLYYFASYAILYWFVWAFIEHKLREQEKLKIEPLLLVSFTAILFMDVVLSLIETYLLADELSLLGKTVLYLYQLISCLFEYAVLYAVLEKRQAEEELATVENLWQQDRRSYELSRENIELINVKCHDLKHQIRKLRSASGSVIDEQFLSELENHVSIYDNSIQTGNSALDLLFAENSNLLAKYRIKLSVLADGECLSVLSDTDIYSLFGNALHNAMEAVIKTEDAEKRVIRLRVHREGGMIGIHMENWCPGAQFDAGGLPRTSKEEKGHGYGMRSMQMIAEKYGGFLAAQVAGELFLLDIVLPAETKGERKQED